MIPRMPAQSRTKNTSLETDRSSNSLGRIGEPITEAWLAVSPYPLTRKIHHDLNTVAVFTSTDLVRHQNILKIRQKYFSSTDIPDYWILKDNKPTSELDLEIQGQRLMVEASTLGQACNYENNIHEIILADIGELFLSLSKRTDNEHVRTDGVEVMFFNDLVDWFLTKAPTLPPKHEHAAFEYQKIINYCKDIKQSIIFDPDNCSQNNFYETLKWQITRIEDYHVSLREFQGALTLNGLLTQLENHLLGLSSRVLDITYLLINEEPSVFDDLSGEEVGEKRRLGLATFIKPFAYDKAEIAARNTVFGEWLYKTVTTLRLTSSFFPPSNNLTIHDFTHHLEDELHPDGSFIKTKPNWGHRKFAQLPNEKYSDGKKKANHYALQIKLQLQRTVEIYYLIEALIRPSQTSPSLTNGWMYSNPGGKASLMELMRAILETSDNFWFSFRQFWKEYYEEDFKSYITQNHLNPNAPEHQPLARIHCKLIGKMESRHRSIKDVVDVIFKNAEDFPQTTQKILDTYSIENILAYRQLMNKTDSPDYRIAFQELLKFRHGNKKTVILDDISTIDSTAIESNANIENKNTKKANRHQLFTISTVAAVEDTTQSSSSVFRSTPSGATHDT